MSVLNRTQRPATFPVALGTLLTGTIFVAACTGVVGAPGPAGNGLTAGSVAGGGAAGASGSNAGSGASQSGAEAAACTGQPSPGPAPLRRLTQSEYNSTVRDLLGDTTQPASSFPPDQQIGDFTNTAVALTVPPLLAQAYQTAAEQLAGTAVSNMAALVACDPVQTGEDACAQQFVQTFGKRAFRRPLTADEQSGLVALYHANRSGADFTNGVRSVVEAVLQSAPFLYRVEFGDATGVVATSTPPVVPLTAYEMASRLSYFLWDSMPDDALLTAADAGQLTTADQIAAQVGRMLADAKAKPAVEQFYGQWLTLDDVASIAKDPTTYPEFTPTLQAAMRAETLAFVDWVMWQSDGRLSTLLTSPTSFVNAELAAVYGVAGVTGAALQQVQLDPAQRSGLLTQLSLMTLLGKPDRSSPVLRGKFVRERLLCQTIAPPPANIVITPPPIKPGVTTREMFSMHSQVEPCKSCHALMDPIGFGFENYDGVGKWRAVDEGQPVDASGTLSSTDVDGLFDGAVGLAAKLAQSREVSDCMVTEWFRYAFGRGETAADGCSLDSMRRAFAASNLDVRALLVAVTETDAFRYRPEVTP